MNSEEALYYLGILVEYGKKAFVDTLREYGYGTPEARATQEINKIFLVVPEEKLLNDRDFALSLHLGLLRLFGEDRENFEENFSKRLSEIFSRPLAEKLYGRALTFETELAKRLRGLSEAEKKEAERKLREEEYSLYAKRKKVLLPAERPYASQPAKAGATSMLVPCPQCGLKKRCFQNTKRFRCQCGYENPNYRYGSTA